MRRCTRFELLATYVRVSSEPVSFSLGSTGKLHVKRRMPDVLSLCGETMGLCVGR